jgi:hypothetical protein
VTRFRLYGNAPGNVLLACSPYPARLTVEYWPGMLWNAGPTSRGILARHAVESAEGGSILTWGHSPDSLAAPRNAGVNAGGSGGELPGD